MTVTQAGSRVSEFLRGLGLGSRSSCEGWVSGLGAPVRAGSRVSGSGPETPTSGDKHVLIVPLSLLCAKLFFSTCLLYRPRVKNSDPRRPKTASNQSFTLGHVGGCLSLLSRLLSYLCVTHTYHNISVMKHEVAGASGRREWETVNWTRDTFTCSNSVN